MADEIKTDITLPDVPAKVVAEAQMEGIKSAIAESAAQQFKSTDGVATTSEPEPGITPTYDVFHLQDRLELSPDALTDWMKGKGGEAVPSLSQVAGLVEVERSGKNRTDVVKALCKHLGIKSPYEVTDAGPGYTNDVSRNLL